jgi:predicted NUDIX family NTP pyrophosphohydrolase
MPKKSAGILLYRIREGKVEVLLAHPGGPLWIKKDDGYWSIPKGEFTDDEEPLEAAKREFYEETGASVSGEFIPLKPITQKSGKLVYGFAIEGEFDVSRSMSNTFKMEWPPYSGKVEEYPEIDRAEWFDLERAKEKLTEAQHSFIDELIETLGRQQIRNSSMN